MQVIKKGNECIFATIQKVLIKYAVLIYRVMYSYYQYTMVAKHTLGGSADSALLRMW